MVVRLRHVYGTESYSTVLISLHAALHTFAQLYCVAEVQIGFTKAVLF